MYIIDYLPIALEDMVGIAKYIDVDLQNYLAAERLSNVMINKIENLSLFPYSNPVYHPMKALKEEYRKLKVKNFIVFYYVEEETKVVTIARVLYNKRNISEVLD